MLINIFIIAIHGVVGARKGQGTRSRQYVVRDIAEILEKTSKNQHANMNDHELIRDCSVKQVT